ncbi:MAG: two-component regulator propeller domain-containing protein [Ferruginibacter sp.]
MQSNITDIKEDKRGNIWIGTQGGLAIFNGKKFINYDDQDILQSLEINSIFCDSAGIVWVATSNGLLRYDHQFHIFFKPFLYSQNNTNCLTANSESLFFLCNNTIYQIGKDQVVKKYFINDSIEKTVLFFAFDKNDNLWLITTDSRIYKIKNSKITEFYRHPLMVGAIKKGYSFFKIITGEQQSPYFVSNFGTFFLDKDTLLPLMYRYSKFKTANVGQGTFVYNENDSTIWVGGTKGLCKLINEDSSVSFTKSNGFCNNSVSCILKDKENNLWVGCTFNGVYKLSNEACFSLSNTDSADLKDIRAVAVISNTQTLLGSWGNGVYLLSHGTVSEIPFPEKMQNKYVTTLTRDGESTYIGTLGPGGIWKLDNRTLKMTRVEKKVVDQPIFKIFIYHDKLLLQALNGTSYMVDKKFSIIDSTKSYALGNITVVKNEIYGITTSGIVNILDSNFNVLKNFFTGNGTEVNTIESYKNLVLFGTLGQGVLVFDTSGKLIKKINKNTGLNSNAIYSLLVDENNLFIGSNVGLTEIDLSNMTIRIFEEKNGMFNGECRKNGLVKQLDKSVLIATTNGIYIYYPLNDNTNKMTKGYLTTTSFSCGKSLENIFPIDSLSNNVYIPYKIPYSENQIAITLKGVSQRSPDNIEYHYKLEGYDNKWKTTGSGNNVFQYNSLSPGNYVFKAYITLNGSSSETLSIHFIIKKPLQSELWFQAIIVILLAMFLLMLMIFFNKIYEKYIQTKMIDRLEAVITQKKEISDYALTTTQTQLSELKKVLMNYGHDPQINILNITFLIEALKRIKLLWKFDTISVNEFHKYFDDIFITRDSEAIIYHNITVQSVIIPVEKAFKLMELFSLFAISILAENHTAMFSLNSEVRLNKRLVLKFYTVNNLKSRAETPIFTYFKSLSDKLKKQGWSLEVIENPEASILLIVEIDI